jgi:hypothetical protein
MAGAPVHGRRPVLGGSAVSGGSAVFWIVVAAAVLYGLPAGIFHSGTPFVVAAAIWWPVLTVFIVVCVAGSYRARHPAARRVPGVSAGAVLPGGWPAPGLSPEDEFLALSLELAAARPACNHVTAVAVASVLDPLDIVAFWCPRCETQLPAQWRPGR